MKRDILKQAQYWYNFDRDVFYNRAARKAFSIEYVDDHTEEELLQRLKESGNPSGWTFYFNRPPAEDAQRELERVLG